MSRRSPLFSLSALTRAYQRNLKAFARVTKPVRAAKPVRAKAVAVSRARPKAAPVARTPRKPLPASGEWLAGIAPGPAGARRFHLYVPPGLALRAGEKLPLLVMLHGCGQTGRELAASSRMNRLAVRHRFLVLYPEQERLANAHGCWNWFDRRSGKADAEAATLLAAIELVARRHPVDMARVAVAGLSAGASMAALLAARYPDRFCAGRGSALGGRQPAWRSVVGLFARLLLLGLIRRDGGAEQARLEQFAQHAVDLFRRQRGDFLVLFRIPGEAAIQV